MTESTLDELAGRKTGTLSHNYNGCYYINCAAA